MGDLASSHWWCMHGSEALTWMVPLMELKRFLKCIWWRAPLRKVFDGWWSLEQSVPSIEARVMVLNHKLGQMFQFRIESDPKYSSRELDHQKWRTRFSTLFWKGFGLLAWFVIEGLFFVNMEAYSHRSKRGKPASGDRRFVGHVMHWQHFVWLSLASK